jgi:branched-chain amino acid transport system substrate-binding protein
VLTALAGCGSKHKADTAGSRIHGRVLTVYASVPLNGASRVSGEAVVSGARLALSEVHGRVGEYQIALKVLDDATAKRGGWDPGQTTINARVAVLDPTTIGYLGELNSGASAVSIPPLNRAGIRR